MGLKTFAVRLTNRNWLTQLTSSNGNHNQAMIKELNNNKNQFSLKRLLTYLHLSSIKKAGTKGISVF